MRLREKNKKWISILLMTCMLASMLAACGKVEKEEPTVTESGTKVFQYGDNVVTKGEVYIYIQTVKERYEMQYGEDIWQTALPSNGQEGVTMENLTREEVVNEIVRVKTLCMYAKESGISLSDEETEELKGKAEAFFKGLTDDQKTNMEITQEKAETVMMENALASKAESQILAEEKIEISDEEARMTTFYDMYFPCYDIATDGNVTPYTDEEKQKQYENAMQACSTLATADLDTNKDAGSIEKLAEYYQLDEAKMQTLSPDEILNTYGQDVYDLLYSMENGQYSTVVESEYGYHVFQMIALTDEEKTQERKVLLYNETVENALSSTIDIWQSRIDPSFSYPNSVDMKVYDSIVFQ